MPAFKLIIGLGNPGTDYAKTRHNAGFWFVESLSTLDFSLNTRFKSKFCEINSANSGANNRIYLALPQTYMNKSGEAVSAIAQFYKIQINEILVAHDELDLAPGIIRLKKGGGHGGHNGLKSIISHLGSNDFVRLRIGIGHPGHAADVANYVLKKPLLDENIAIDLAILRALSFKDDLLAGQIDSVMNKLHTK